MMKKSGFVNRRCILIRECLALLTKELLLEIRNPGGVFLSLASAVILVIAVSFAASVAGMPQGVNMLLYWIVVLFACMQSLPHSFLRERLEHTYLFLRIIARPAPVFFSKLIFNILLCVFFAVRYYSAFCIFLFRRILF